MAEITATHNIASSSTASASALKSTPYVHYDIFVHHYADETREFAMELCKRLVSRGLFVFLDGSEKEVTSGMQAAISLASLQIAIFSPNYATCKWCMDTLVHMTKSEAPILPVFYRVEPYHLRYKDKCCEGTYDAQTIQAWRNALRNVSNISGFVLEKCNGGEEELLCKIMKSVERVESVMKTWSRRGYHVFICHRGETKKEFAEPLYRRLHGLMGLRVFLDDQEMVAAHRIDPQIEAAIQLASVNIVIFSPGFPTSQWCLHELSLMTTLRANILPVFYGVKPSDLDGFYNETLLSHLEKGRHNIETIKRWRGALANVPKSDDLMLAKIFRNKEENIKALMNKIVESVLKYIPEPSEVSRQSSEVQRAVESILDEDVSKQFKVIQRKRNRGSLPHSQPGVFPFSMSPPLFPTCYSSKVVGILGAAGIGKTTLAKEICKISKFKESSVLFNLRERALKDLEGKVIEDFKQHLPSCDALAESVKQHLPFCDALAVILDEVDHVDQLHALLPIKNVLPPESLILVTSSAKDVLNISGIPDSSIYHLAGLNREDSRKLLLSYAFDLPYLRNSSIYHLRGLNIQDFQNLLLSYDLNRPFPRHPSDDPVFESLVENFVMACDGLPLPLKELGERLSGKDRSVWEEQLNQLRHNCILPGEIKHKLNICYDSLNEVEQQIFLDVACFFIGEDSDSATRIFGMEGLEKLENRCLLQVTSKIEMNELLRNYGRNKANRLTPRRLWHQETKQINDLLEKSSSELAQFRGITMNGDPGDETEMPCCKQSGETFSDSRNLKFLAAQGGYVDKILTRVGSADLLWLKWHKCTHSSLPSWFYMEKLRVLEVDGSKLTELWQTESQAPLQLRELNICAPLSLFPQSIGQLKLLEKIVVKYSGPLPFKDLPQEFCRLRSLKYLEMTECSGIMSLPDSFGDLANLQYLDLKGASHLKMLPKSFRNLTQLEYLFLEGCSEIRVLPGLEKFTSLKTLDVKGCKNLESIPELGQLKELKILDVSGCSQIESLSGLEHLNSLEMFIVSGCQKLQSIPGLGKLTKLPELNVSGCSEIKLLPGLENLTSLESFNVSGCQKLQSIGGLGKLTKLQTLDVTGCSEIQTLPGLKHLTSLETFNVRRCEKLQSIDVSGSREIHTLSGLKHLTSLKKLNVSGCENLQNIGWLGQLRNLKTLNVSGCEKLQSIRGLGRLTNLQILNLSRCYEIRELPGVELLTSLETLNISECKNLRNKGWLRQLRKLQTLDVGGCQIQRLLGLKYFTSLKTLNVSGCKKLQSIRGLGQLRKLQILNLSRCYEIRELPGVERLTSLETLNVSECCELGSIPELGKLTKLQILNVSGCQELQNIPELGKLTKLQILNVRGCYEIQELPSVERLTSLEKLNVSNCWKLQNIPELGKLTKLQTLKAVFCFKMQSLLGLECLTSLKTLKIGSDKLHSIPELAQLKKLQKLYVNCESLQRMPSLEHLTSLQRLDITVCWRRLESIPTLGSLTKLRNLNLHSLCNYTEVPNLEHLTSLETLNLFGFTWLKSIPELGQQLKKLQTLHIGDSDIETLPSLEHLTSLQSLHVYKCGNLQSIPSLEHLTNVETLNVHACGEIKSLQGLEHLISLKKLSVCECKKLASMPGLGHLTKLETLDVIRCQQIKTLPGLEHLVSLKELNVGNIDHSCFMTSLEEKCGLQTLRGLEHLISLESLNVRDCEELGSIPQLRFLQKLKSLYVWGCPKIQDLPGVEYAMSLERLQVKDCPSIRWGRGVLEQLRQRKTELSGDAFRGSDSD